MKTVVVLMLVVLPSLVLGQTAQQPAATLNPSDVVVMPRNMLTPDQSAYIQNQQTQGKIEAYGKYIGLGKEIGQAIDGGLSSVTEEALKISDSGLGRFIMFLIAWRVLGNDLFQIIIGIPLLLVGLWVWIASYRRNCFPAHILVREDGNSKCYEWKYPDTTMDMSYVMWGHMGALMAFIGLVAWVMFG